MMDTTIDPNVSPTFAPENFAEGSDERAAAKAIYESLGKYHAAVSALNGDPTLNGDARLLQQLRLLEGVVARTTPQLDAITQKLAEREKFFARELEIRATTFGSKTQEPWEIRGAVTQMKDSATKVEFIRKLAYEGDREALATLNRPWTLGIEMGPVEWRGFREDLHRILEPELAQRLDSARKAAERWSRLATAFATSYWHKTLDQKTWNVARKAEQRRAAVEAARA